MKDKEFGIYLRQMANELNTIISDIDQKLPEDARGPKEWDWSQGLESRYEQCASDSDPACFLEKPGATGVLDPLRAFCHRLHEKAGSLGC